MKQPAVSVDDRELLSVITGTFFIIVAARFALSPLVPDIMQTFSVSKSTVGIALSGMWAAWAIFQLPGGVLSDYLGERRVILLALAATAGASLVLSLTPTFGLFFLFVVLIGATTGLYLTAGISVLASNYENTGRALGIHEIGAATSGLITPIMVSYLANLFDWRIGLFCISLATIAAFSVVRWQVPEIAPRSSHQNKPLTARLNIRQLQALFTRPGVAFTIIIATVGFFTWQAFVSFFPTFLVEYAGLSRTEASTVFAVIFAITIGGSPLLGWLSDITGRDTVLAVSMLSGVSGYLVFLFGATGRISFVAGTAFLGVGLSWPAVINSRFMDHLSYDERGTNFGLARSGVLLISSLGSVVTGVLADYLGWSIAYGFITVLLILVVILIGSKLAYNFTDG